MREIEKWVTISGRRIPIFKGATVDKKFKKVKKEKETVKKDLQKAKDKFKTLCINVGKDYLLDEYDLNSWTLRDFVSEVQSLLDFEKESDFADKDYMNHYRKFINLYKNKIANIKVTEKHFSKYDK